MATAVVHCLCASAVSPTTSQGPGVAFAFLLTRHVLRYVFGQGLGRREQGPCLLQLRVLFCLRFQVGVQAWEATFRVGVYFRGVRLLYRNCARLFHRFRVTARRFCRQQGLLLFFRVPLRRLPIRRVRSRVEKRTIASVLRAGYESYTVVPYGRRDAFLFTMRVGRGHHRCECGDCDGRSGLYLPRRRRLIFLLLGRGPVYRRNEVLLVARDRIYHARPSALVPSEVVGRIIPLRVIVDPLMITNFLMGLLGMFVASVCRVEISTQESCALKRWAAYLLGIFLGRDRFCFLHVSVV